MYCTNCGSELESGRCSNCKIVYNSVAAAQRDVKQQNSPGTEAELANTEIKAPKEKRIKEKRIKEKAPKEKIPRRKKKKLFIILAAAFLVVAVAGSVLAVYFVRDAKYNDAIAMLKKEKLEDAATAFEDLGNFKNSPDFLEETLTMIDYFDAKEALEDGDYEDAISMFDDLGKYANSKNLRDLAQQHFDYEAAKVLFDSGAFEQAKIAYLTLGNFEDSIAMAESCQLTLDYDEAQSLYQTGQFLAAKNIFETIPEYQDSKDMAFICECVLNLEEAKQKIDNRSYTSAIPMLNRLEADIKNSSIDFTQILPLKEIIYYRGLAFFEQDLFYSAYQEFKSAAGFLDASSKAGQCKQPIATKELYENPNYDRDSIKVTTYAPTEGGYSACVKVYTESRVLISTYLIAYNEKLKIYLPVGTYYFDVSFGKEWFGMKEAFGNDFERTGPEKLRSGRYYTWRL